MRFFSEECLTHKPGTSSCEGWACGLLAFVSMSLGFGEGAKGSSLLGLLGGHRHQPGSALLLRALPCFL